MHTKYQKVTRPLIINVAEDGARLTSFRLEGLKDEECLIVIYPRPTIRQARVQFWMSLKMFAGAIGRGLRGYMRRINRGHEAAYRVFTQESHENDRSSTHGLS